MIDSRNGERREKMVRFFGSLEDSGTRQEEGSNESCALKDEAWGGNVAGKMSIAG